MEGSNQPIFEGVSSLRKMAYIFILSGQLCQLFAFASGLVASSAGTGAMHVIAGLCYGSATFLLVFYWCLPEIQNNNAILYAVFGLCFAAALFIFIGMCVHASTEHNTPYYSIKHGTPYYSTMLICFSAFLAIGGGVCVILDMTGFQLKASPTVATPSTEPSGTGPPAGHDGDPNKV